MKPYKAIFFDWDGTAVLSRKAPVTDVVAPMKQLLSIGKKLVIVSGTTYDNIAGGKLHTYFTPKEAENLYLGLGRGAYNYRFDGNGLPYVWKDVLPNPDTLLKIHDITYKIHRELLGQYHFPTDIVFSRPNYCKIDLMVGNNRGDQLFMQEDEAGQLSGLLKQHGFPGGIKALIGFAEELSQAEGLPLSATTDAKYLEIGLSSKSDNVNTILSHLQSDFGITPEECSFWGDEYIGFGDGLYGSDSFMITPISRAGDFYDVSSLTGDRPEGVHVVGGGVDGFIRFLTEQGTANSI